MVPSAEFKKEYIPTVSIIVPTYNREKWLRLMVPTLLGQSFKDFELIIVDDGSTDDTAEYIQSLKDPRIVYLHWANKTEYPATNLGFRAAKGKFLAIAHSDDLLPKDSLTLRVAALEQHPDIDFVHGNIDRLDENGKITAHLDAFDGTAREAFKIYYTPKEQRPITYPVHFPTILFRRELLDKTGYLDETLPCSGDFDWLLRALLHGEMRKINATLYQYRKHPEAKHVNDRKFFPREPVNEVIFNRYRHAL